MTSPRDTTFVHHNGSNGIYYAELTLWVDEDRYLYVATAAGLRPGERVAEGLRSIVADGLAQP